METTIAKGHTMTLPAMRTEVVLLEDNAGHLYLHRQAGERVEGFDLIVYDITPGGTTFAEDALALAAGHAWEWDVDTYDLDAIEARWVASWTVEEGLTYPEPVTGPVCGIAARAYLGLPDDD